MAEPGIETGGSQAGAAQAAAPATIRDLLAGRDAAVAIGVHNALGAKLAEEAGADALWISSFEVHAAARLPDADILGTQDYVNVIHQIVDRVQIPVLVDGDAGGGNAINTIRLVREFEKAGASAMCIEDNTYPKRCTFYEGTGEQLERSSTFAGKLLAAVEKKTHPDFSVIARIEALNKGLGVDAALERARDYAAVGVDAILIHHKGSEPGPVLEFADRWYRDNTIPLVCVPTTYKDVQYAQLNDAGFKLIIFANYGVRSIVKALRATFGDIMGTKRLADADEHVVSMQEIFDLIFLDELKENEARYIR
jgi:phosphoenolpyruvate phosphomutase